jgi:hypothetical protein
VTCHIALVEAVEKLVGYSPGGSAIGDQLLRQYAHEVWQTPCGEPLRDRQGRYRGPQVNTTTNAA